MKSDINHANISSTTSNCCDWFIYISDGSVINNSSISESYNGIYLGGGSKIKNSKVFNISRHAFEIQDNSEVTGSEIYDVNKNESQSYDVYMNNSSFTNNRVYRTANTTNNYAIYPRGTSVIEYNTIGGSTGSHGAVGIAIRYNDNLTIRYNNIGGYTSNVAVHGYQGSQSYVFTENTFMGTLSGDQKHATVFNGSSSLSGYNQSGNSFNEDDEDLRIDFENNYWGSTDSDEIEAMIHDAWDEFKLIGLIDYNPWSSSASTASPIQTPSGLTKALSGSDVILTWDAVSATDLAGYKIYSKDGDSYSLVQDVTDESLTSFTITGGDIETSYVVTAYDTDADGTTDQNEGYESWYSSEFSKLSFSLSATSSDGLTTVGDVSTFDTWLQAGNGGETEIYDR